MAKKIPIFLNCSRNAILAMPPAFRKAEALEEVKIFVIPRALRCEIIDVNNKIPDFLVSEEMAERYLDDDFSAELSNIYVDVRCRYLHSGPIQCLRNDALRTITAAYKLMTIFIGFPEDLFLWMGGGPACKDEADPRFIEFYKPYW